MGGDFAFVLVRPAIGGDRLESLVSSLAIRFGCDVVGTYFVVVSTRMIGLYYRHYKQRFAFKLE